MMEYYLFKKIQMDKLSHMDLNPSKVQTELKFFKDRSTKRDNYMELEEPFI